MKLQTTGKDLFLCETENFDPFVSCECGQCFRFEKIGEEEYTLAACNRKVDIFKVEGGWLFKSMTEEEFSESFIKYFDLDRDYGEIIKSFDFDETVSKAAAAGGGIRIFRQDPWETLVSFIISQNNNIPRIKKIINSLCELLGEERDGFYAFPSPEKILKAGLDGIAPIKSGFRAKYILDAAEKVVSGTVSLERIAESGYESALAELKLIKGVGDKVANCVLLFGFGYYEAFPVDVWFRRVMAEYYPDGLDVKSLGRYAGIAQQYLFHYKRNTEEKA